jgi:hypothetical protein
LWHVINCQPSQHDGRWIWVPAQGRDDTDRKPTGELKRLLENLIDAAG